MPKTRAARSTARASAREAERLLIELPADVLGHILYYLPLAHNIALTGLTCHALCAAAKLAFKARPFSGEVVTLAGHAGAINGVAAAPDGRVITGSSDHIVMVWRDGVCEATFSQHQQNVMAVSVLPGGARVVSIDDNGVAMVWALSADSKYTLERTFDVDSAVYNHATVILSGVPYVVGHHVVEDDDEHEERKITLHDLDGTLTHTFAGPREGWVNAVVATLDGQKLITSASEESNVNIWMVATKTLVSACEHPCAVEALSVMPNDQRFLSGSDDGDVRVWAIDGSLQDTFKLQYGGVNALVALPDNQHALSGGGYHDDDAAVKLFNVNDGNVMRTFTHHSRQGYCLALLPDGLRFVSGSVDRTACIVEHGLAATPAPSYVAAFKEVLKARVKAAEEGLRRAREELAAFEAKNIN